MRPLTQAWDRSVGSIEWAKDGKSLLVTAEDTLEQPIFRIDAATGAVTRLTRDGHYANVRALPGGAIAATMNSIAAPDDLYGLDSDGRATQLTNVNGKLLAELDPIAFRKFSFKGANNDTVWGWSLKPANAAGPLPIAFLVHGGPQGSFPNAWSYRWNPRVFISPGYAAVASISTAPPVTARPSPTRSARIGAAGRSRTCRRASPSPPPATRSSMPAAPARWAAPTAAT